MLGITGRLTGQSPRSVVQSAVFEIKVLISIYMSINFECRSVSKYTARGPRIESRPSRLKQIYALFQKCFIIQ
jgi:hypothetical protein